MILDQTREHDQAPLLASPHKFKLAVFAFNGSGGLTITSADGPPEVSWEESKRIAVMADEAGMDAIIPIGRWRGFGGELNFNHRSFETFTWAAAIAAITERIQVFATFHVPTVHPVRAAKEIATIDHISGGRFGLNILAGWQAEELAMFGLTSASTTNATTTPKSGSSSSCGAGRRTASSTGTGSTSSRRASTRTRSRSRRGGRR